MSDLRLKTAAAMAFLWLAAPASAAADAQASCAIQNEVVRLLVQSEHFLHHLETGEYGNAPADLDQRLRIVSLTALRLQLEDAGLGDAADPVERMVLQQRLLLRANRVEGRAAASASAADLNAAAALRQVRSQALNWPCFDSSRAFNGLGLGAGGANGSGAPSAAEELQSLLFGLISLLAVGAASYFWWRGKIDQRQTRRFSCWIPGTIQCRAGLTPVAIVDISRSGARLRCDAALQKGERVTLRIADQDVEGKIVRPGRRHSGVHFTAQLTGAFILETLETYG